MNEVSERDAEKCNATIIHTQYQTMWPLNIAKKKATQSKCVVLRGQQSPFLLLKFQAATTMALQHYSILVTIDSTRAQNIKVLYCSRQIAGAADAFPSSQIPAGDNQATIPLLKK